jgi:uncharacterized protein YkwD
MRHLSCYPLHRVIFLLCLALAPGCATVPQTTTHYPEDSKPYGPAPDAASCPTPARTASDAAEIVALINAERGKNGLGPVRLSPKLSAVAQQHACDNAARSSTSHQGSDGSDLSERLRRGGIQPQLAAENTGLGFTSPARAFAWWMASPAHRANILLKGITEIGVGEADGAQPAWVIDFLQ